MTQHDGGAVAACDINTSSRCNGRGENEIANSFQPQRVAAWLTSHGIKPAQDILIVTDHIKCVFVEQGRGHVWRVAFELPDDLIRSSDIALCAGDSDPEHRLGIVAVPSYEYPTCEYRRGDDVF